MTNYQFRTNWRGQLVLQRLHSCRGQFGDREYHWSDATTQDLKNYYEQLCKIQAACACQEQRSLFDMECG